jgi:NAD(P)-dependent dehydrogenase (short-subunit alcohol dehydrogenase family)
MNNTFTDKIIIITGAGSGIGKGLAEAFGQQKAQLILLDINVESVKAVCESINAQGGKAEYDVLDVSNEARTNEIWQYVAKKYNRIDYVFNNAGFGIIGESENIPTEQWLKMINVNLMGVVYGSMEAFRIMKENGGGYIVNTASLAGLIGAAGSLPYATTKTAVVGFSTSLRAEAAPFGVKVIAICPGFIETGIYENSWSEKMSGDKLRKSIRLPVISLDEAVAEILKGITRNKRLIIFPRYAKSLYWMARFFPSWLEKKQIKGMEGMRRYMNKKEL